ncbi:retrovirus-related pol polyprotein from transposon TNT 1-94 [Tanacetum coccineum]
MLEKKPNKVCDTFLKAGLGYTNPERLKKVIEARPKMYDGDLIHNNKLGIHTTDSEETLEDAEESQNKMRHKMIQIDYEKLNALYETFVPQQEFSVEQTYFSISSTSHNGSTSKDVPSKSPGLKNANRESVEGLGHNLFSVGQLCDRDLEVAFLSNTCYVWNLEGDDLLTGSRDSNLYTISISKMAATSPVCLMSRATSTKSWLWHRRSSYFNFDTINQLTSYDLVNGLLKFKYRKNHLCLACEQGKSRKASLSPKLVPSTESKLELLHMDLCGPMRVASINGKKYILMIVDDYSRDTRVYFLHTKDEAPDMIIDFVNQVQRNLKALILTIKTDNGTKFKNEKLRSFYAKLVIVHKTSIAQMPQQNGVVERRNRTLVEAARTMLIFSKAPEFLWVEAIATTCFTHNRSIVHTQHNKTPKMKPKANIGIFVGYSESSCGFRIYNRRTKKIMETIHVKFDELTTMASECKNLEPRMNCSNFNDLLEDSQSVPSTLDLDNLFGPMYEEYYSTSLNEVSENFVADTLDNDPTFSPSSIVVD